MKKALHRTTNWIKNKVKDADLFPSTVKFTFNGETEFKTLYGGLVSLMIKTVVIIYAISLTVSIFTKSGTSKSVNKLVRDLSYDKTKHFIGKSTFAFGIKLIGPNPELLLDKTYFNLLVSNTHYVKDVKGGSYNQTLQPIELEY